MNQRLTAHCLPLAASSSQDLDAGADGEDVVDVFDVLLVEADRAGSVVAPYVLRIVGPVDADLVGQLDPELTQGSIGVGLKDLVFDEVGPFQVALIASDADREAARVQTPQLPRQFVRVEGDHRVERPANEPKTLAGLEVLGILDAVDLGQELPGDAVRSGNPWERVARLYRV